MAIKLLLALVLVGFGGSGRPQIPPIPSLPDFPLGGLRQDKIVQVITLDMLRYSLVYAPAPPVCYDCYRGPVRLLIGPLTRTTSSLVDGALKGDKVYSIYINTALGTAVMEYSDPTSANHPYADDLVAPRPLSANLPAHLQLSRLVISCVLDTSGSLGNLQVREQTGGSEITNQILAALSRWKFYPAYRGDRPVEVTAYLGFGFDTR
jgi:hypothetical protein